MHVLFSWMNANLSELKRVQHVDLVAGEASVAQMIASTHSTSVALPVNGAQAAVVASHPEMQGGSLNMESPGRRGMELFAKVLKKKGHIRI